MNLVVFGIFSLTTQGIEGSIFLMLAHGIVSGALFFLVGSIYDRHLTRSIMYYGGLTQVMPYFSFYFLFFTLANMSFPGTCNFVGELLILVGIFQANPLVAFFAASGVVLSAAYSI
jgi:NADH-quinone oxidoreductase subunit M